tara:strand:+ start:5844 stop:6956 length:1113 start_codon:yes stop_codon:yes gene_type:complete
MKHQTLIIFDQLLRPLYVLLNLLKWGKKEPHINKNFIALKFFGIGSITRIVHVMDTIGIEKGQVTFITLHKNKAIIDLLNLNAVYIKTKHPLVLINSLLKVIFHIWNQKQTAILDMERTSNLSGLFRLIVGIGKSCNSFYFKPENKYKKGQLFVSMSDKPATQAIAEMFHRTYVHSDEYIDVPDSNKVFVNINAGNYCPERKFPLSEYAVLIKMLYDENPDWCFYLTGIKSELAFVSSFKDQLVKLGIPSNSILNIAGQHNLHSFISFLKEAKLFITNDSGPLHLAHLFNIKTVGIWGPTSPKLIGYQNSKKMLNLESELTCSPCFIHPKSPVAKYCQGDLTCFKAMGVKKMASDIIKFVEYQKIDASVV